VNRRQVKKEIFLLLAQHDVLEPELKLSSFSRIAVINSLFMALCDTNELIKWRAVEYFGLIVPAMAKEKEESARVILRRFLWTLNDESGGIGWGAPEAMAQIMCHSDLLRQEYLHMLISYMQEDGEELYQDGNYLELPLLQRGLLWGIGTLCHTFPEEMKTRIREQDVKAYFSSEDRTVQHLALWVLSGIGGALTCEEVETLDMSDTNLTIYQTGELKTVDVRTIFESLACN
jgi:hypothetical protein